MYYLWLLLWDTFKSERFWQGHMPSVGKACCVLLCMSPTVPQLMARIPATARFPSSALPVKWMFSVHGNAQPSPSRACSLSQQRSLLLWFHWPRKTLSSSHSYKTDPSDFNLNSKLLEFLPDTPRLDEVAGLSTHYCLEWHFPMVIGLSAFSMLLKLPESRCYVCLA